MIITLFLVTICVLLYPILIKPKNSLDLYYHIIRSDEYEDVKKLTLDKEESRFTREQYENIMVDRVSPSKIRQFTILEYGKNGSILLETSPGTEKLYILHTEELPKDIAEYLREMDEDN